MPWTAKDAKDHKKGLTKKQSEQWAEVANSVLSECMKAGGKEETCAGKAIQQANGVIKKEMENNININTQLLKAYETREETFENKKYLVVPVTMMVEGVHSGSRGPLLHLASEFGKVPAAWNGIPVTIQHPQNADGDFVSANSPEVLTNWAVGRVFNAEVTKDNKLKGEAWLEVEKLQNLSAETYQHIVAGSILEVSVGNFADEDEQEGVWGTEQYIAVSRNPRPDHLALLPGAVGACSVKDGCGIRVNSSQTKKGGQSNVEVLTAIQVLKESGYAVPSSFQLNKDETGYEEKLMGLRNLVRSLNPQNQIESQWEYNYLIEAFDGYLIYEHEQSGKPAQYFKRNYQFNVKDNMPEFTSDPVEVKKKLEFKEIENNQEFQRTKFNNNSKGGSNMSEPCKPCIKAKVDKLIANSQFCEDDRTYLEGLEESRLDTFLTAKPAATPQVNTSVTKEAALEALRGNLKPEEFMALLPAETQEQLRTGLAVHQAQKTKMITEIQANADGVWQEEELKAMGFETLSKIHKSIAPKASSAEDFNYAILGAGGLQPQVNQKVDIEPMPLTGVEFGK